MSALDAILNDPPELWAIHEAGHTVASAALRHYAGRVSIEPGEKHLGMAEVWVLPDEMLDEEKRIIAKDSYSPEEQSALEDVVVIAMAGPVAETIHWTHRDYFDVLSKNSGDQELVMTVLQKAWAASQAEKETELEARTRSLLIEHWQAVKALAAALEERTTLRQAEVEEILLRHGLHLSASPSSGGEIS